MGSASASSKGKGTAARWSLRLLGGFDLLVLSSGERVASVGKRERVLLAVLALSPESRASRTRLATLLWGEASDETAIDNLRTTVFNLRKALNDDKHHVIARDGEDIVLDTSAFEIDALAFRRHASGTVVSELETATKLYGGEFLNGLSIDSEGFEAWRREEEMRFRDQAVDVLTRLMRLAAGAGENEAAIRAGSRLLQLEPLHEPAVRLLMQLYAGSGRRGAAVELYRRLSQSLRAELDAEPEAETNAAFAALARAASSRADNAADVRQRPEPVSGGTETNRRSFAPTKSTWIVVAGVVAAVLLASLFELASWNRGSAPGQTASVASQDASSLSVSIPSIAVLPFSNLSGDPTQDFLSEGMTEELITALAKIPGMRMVARESALQLKGQHRELQAISQQLNATYLIAGSVRKSRNRVRVAAQLIRAEDGAHVWADSYDRELTDLFVIEEEIARAIASALRKPLGLAPGERLVSGRTGDLSAYQEYRRAIALVRARGENLLEAIAILEMLVERDPGFAPAWAQLAGAYGLAYLTPLEQGVMSRSAEETDRLRQFGREKVQAARQQAIRVEPRSAFVYALMAGDEFGKRNWTGTEDLFRHALALDPSNSEIANYYGLASARTGRVGEFLRLLQQAAAQEPLVDVYRTNLGIAWLVNGRPETAIETLNSAPPGGLNRKAVLAMAYAAVGRFQDAAETVLSFPRTGDFTEDVVQTAAKLLRSASATVGSPETVPVLPPRLDFIYAYIGAPERMMVYLENVLEGEAPAYDLRFVYGPAYAQVRKTERFQAWARRMGFVDYWRARGWSDLCRPVGSDDFVCD